MAQLRHLILLLLWPIVALGQQPVPPTMEERNLAFGTINEAMMSGQMTQAADQLILLANNPEQAVFHALVEETTNWSGNSSDDVITPPGETEGAQGPKP